MTSGFMHLDALPHVQSLGMQPCRRLVMAAPFLIYGLALIRPFGTAPDSQPKSGKQIVVNV